MMKRTGWESSESTQSLRKQIDAYVIETLPLGFPQSFFSDYRSYIEQGTRKESEKAYFERRKQLAAVGLYLQYHLPSEADYEKVLEYFHELLWAVANEFTWCVMAHLPQDKDGFTEKPITQIDLFAAETADALAELVTLHAEILHPFLQSHIKQQIMDRVFIPFLQKEWWWETIQSNWSAVCCGSIGMAALALEQGELRKKILNKVDQGLTYYLKCFKEDGACEEGIGYWVYGFGYYIYYIAMRKELDPEYALEEEVERKLKKIADFPRLVQMDENSYLPFSDVPARTLIPTGLLSYLKQKYTIQTPVCSEITPFDFDHCYRFAHISRNLWWTDNSIFHNKFQNEAVYLSDRQWLLQRWNGIYVAVKGGHNQEQHNHNDVGSFVLALHGELFLADLGAGVYTADYFGEKRYEYIQTRSRYHNVPLLQGQEQIATKSECRVEQVSVREEAVQITMELGMLYPCQGLTSMQRTILSDMTKECVILQDKVYATEDISVEESFMSYLRPTSPEEGRILLTGKRGQMILSYDSSLMDYYLEELFIDNHFKEQVPAYRIGLIRKDKSRTSIVELQFHYQRVQ